MTPVDTAALRELVEKAFPDGAAAFARNCGAMPYVDLLNALPSLLDEVEALREALEKALPELDENYRFHRDMQSSAARVLKAHEAANAARAALGRRTQG
jgi:hypothetical protein